MLLLEYRVSEQRLLADMSNESEMEAGPPEFASLKRLAIAL